MYENRYNAQVRYTLTIENMSGQKMMLKTNPNRKSKFRITVNGTQEKLLKTNKMPLGVLLGLLGGTGGTIGVGHLLTKDELSSGKLLIDGKTIKFHNGLTHQQVVDLLGGDLRRYEETVRNSVTVKLSQNQFDALVSFCFNIGQGAFKSSTLLKRVNAMQWDDVPHQFSRWNKAGGRVIKGLVNRRNKEIELWEGKI